MAQGKIKAGGRDLIRNVIRLDHMFPGGIIPAADNSAVGRGKKINRGKRANTGKHVRNA